MDRQGQQYTCPQAVILGPTISDWVLRQMGHSTGELGATVNTTSWISVHSLGFMPSKCFRVSRATSEASTTSRNLLRKLNLRWNCSTLG